MNRYSVRASWKRCPDCSARLVRHRWKWGKVRTLEYRCGSCTFTSSTRYFRGFRLVREIGLQPVSCVAENKTKSS